MPVRAGGLLDGAGAAEVLAHPQVRRDGGRVDTRPLPVGEAGQERARVGSASWACPAGWWPSLARTSTVTGRTLTVAVAPGGYVLDGARVRSSYPCVWRDAGVTTTKPTAVRLLVSETPATTWAMALGPDDDPRLSIEQQVAGFDTDGATGCFADAGAWKPLLALFERGLIQGERHLDGYEDIDDGSMFIQRTRDEASGGEPMAFATTGDGTHPVWVGRFEAGEVSGVVVLVEGYPNCSRSATEPPPTRLSSQSPPDPLPAGASGAGGSHVWGRCRPPVPPPAAHVRRRGQTGPHPVLRHRPAHGRGRCLYRSPPSALTPGTRLPDWTRRPQATQARSQGQPRPCSPPRPSLSQSRGLSHEQSHEGESPTLTCEKASKLPPVPHG
ncbi:DUF4241 domain-containing protein [Streptomyces sp. NPDC057411]|uniref:DUF4241 domain-containing protein n=1 Tax=unclassified Streptomyces TaxID=2593676 RepID=UPI003628F2DE